MPGAESTGELVFNGYGVSAGVDEKVLEMDGSGRGSIMCMYLMPPNSTLKNGQNEKYYEMHILSQLKKTLKKWSRPHPALVNIS